MHRWLTELIGTFFLVLTVCLSVLTKAPLAPVAIGASLMVMVYMGGHVSGGHYNPAVSLAVLLRGKLEPKEFVPYVVAQLLGAFMAALTANLVLPKSLPVRSFAVAPDPNVGTWGALLVEALYTFALCLVVLNVATSKKTEGNSYYGLAIGFTVAAGATAGGGLSGGAFNPAVGTGPTVVHAIAALGSLADLWIYWVGPLLGGALAAGVFRLQEAGIPGIPQPHPSPQEPAPPEGPRT
jgi:aquaporin Z